MDSRASWGIFEVSPIMTAPAPSDISNAGNTQQNKVENEDSNVTIDTVASFIFLIFI